MKSLCEQLKQKGLDFLVHDGELMVRERVPGAKEKHWHLVVEKQIEIIDEIQHLPKPHLREDGTLVTPMNSAKIYRWWDGGQSIEATLTELHASEAVWKSYSDTPYPEELRSSLHEK